MTKLTKPLIRLSNSKLDGTFGPDRERALVVTLVPGNPVAGVHDVLSLKPYKTLRPETIALIDVYRLALRARVNRELLEKARDRKAKKAQRLANERMARAEKRLFRNHNTTTN